MMHSTHAAHFIVHPLSFVPVAIGKHTHALAIAHIVQKVANVLCAVRKLEHTLATSFVVLPLAFVYVTTHVLHFTLAAANAFFPASHVSVKSNEKMHQKKKVISSSSQLVAVGRNKFTLAVSQTLEPSATISSTVTVMHRSFTLGQIAFPFAVVDGAIGISHHTLALHGASNGENKDERGHVG